MSVPTGGGMVVSVPPAGEVICVVVPPAVGGVGKSCHQMCYLSVHLAPVCIA